MILIHFTLTSRMTSTGCKSSGLCQNSGSVHSDLRVVSNMEPFHLDICMHA